MTRKDYQIIAKALADSRPMGRSLLTKSQWAETVDKIADALKKDNGGFDKDRFLRACKGE